MYKLNPKVDTSGIDSLTLFEFPPAGLVELFGDAADSDGFKISRKHVFTSDRGDVFAVYDWKQTTLYRGANSTPPPPAPPRGRGGGAPGSDATPPPPAPAPPRGPPTPEEFWRSREPKPLRVGGRLGSNPRPFLKWLQAQYELRAAIRRAGRTLDSECA